MRWKAILSLVFIFAAIAIMFLYLFPMGEISFSGTGNSNFSISNESGDMQFYENMRFPESRISYMISGCPLQRENDMENAFSIMENITSLEFYPVTNNEEISVTCEDKSKPIGNRMFIAGEGGPTNITVSGQFSLITHGEILLIKNSDCEKPNIAIHELLHVLGFQHSLNPENIMYNVTSCSQTIGQDQINLLENLYSYPSYPDLSIKNASAEMNGRFLDINMTVLNEGLASSVSSEINIYADSNIIKTINLIPLEAGEGRIISLGNLFVAKINVNEITLSADYGFSELDKANNNITLKIEK